MAIKVIGDIDVSGSHNLAAADIPNLAASKITSGTLGTARIPNLAASKITSGTFDAARIPDLSATYQAAGSYQAAGNYFTDGDNVINMNNNDGFSYNDNTNVMSVKLDGTLRELYHTGNLTPLTIGTTSSTAMAGNTLSAQDLTDIGNLSGTNTGDQVLPTLSSLGALSTSGGTITGDLTVNGKITQAGIIDREEWGRSYTVNVNAPLPLLTDGGSALPTGGAYRVTGHISGTGTEQVAVAVFWNENGTWYINKTFEGGASSNHVEFKLFDHGSETVPTVTLETHTSNYTVHVAHERLSLEEGTGTDNLRGYFGSDSYLSWLESTNTLTVPGTIAATNISGTNTGDQSIASIKTGIGTGNGKLVPSAGTAGHFLKHDGTFGLPSYTTNTDTQLSDAYVIGLFTGGTNVSIAADGTISSTDTDTVYTHPTGAGNKHIPTGGAAGQFLKYSSSGTAVWATPSYTTNTDTQLSQSEVLGMLTAGNNITISEDGVIDATDTDTVYTHPTSAGNKHIPTGGAAGQFLKYSSSGTATWATPSYTTNTNTTYSAGSGLDLSSTTFSVEADLRDGITHVGKDTNNYVQFDSTNGRIDFYAGGVFVARMESDGDLHIKGDVIAFSDIFS